MKADPKYQAKWLELVNEYKISNQTMKHFSENHDIKIYQLQYWVKKFKTKALDQPISFTEVKVTKPITIESSIKITSGKLIIEIPNNFNDESLLKLLKVVDQLV